MLSRVLLCFGVGVAVACSGSPSAPAGKQIEESEAADSAPPSDTGGTQYWRSALYPEDWSPGYSVESATLRDFSYAGWENNNAPPPDPSDWPHVNILDFGADPTGTEDATEALQAAILSIPEDGQPWVVRVPAGRFRVDGQLHISRDNTFLVGEGSETSELWFTKSEGMDHSGNLTFRGNPSEVQSWMLTEDAPAGSNIVKLASGEPVLVGDEVWLGFLISDAFVEEHGMTGYWTFSANEWRPFFRRTVTNVVVAGDGSQEVTLDNTLPYRILTRDEGRMGRIDGYLNHVGMIGIGVSNAVSWDAAWAGTQVHAVVLDGVHNGWIDDLRSFASPTAPEHHLQSSGILVRNSRAVTIANTHLAYAQNRGEGGNGYLFEIRVSNEILVRDSSGTAGRHNFIQNWDFGTSDLVFLRTTSRAGEAFTSSTDAVGLTACSETHHALAMAVLVDQSTTDDCWGLVNRLSYSSGAGHTATGSVVWNLSGTGSLRSFQYDLGYVIGTSGVETNTEVLDIYDSYGTAPEDYTEGLGIGASLSPASLFDDQLARRHRRR